jgi:hypothetical protein
MNRQLGYSSPADLIDKYPSLYWIKSHVVHPSWGMSDLRWTCVPTAMPDAPQPRFEPILIFP